MLCSKPSLVGNLTLFILNNNFFTWYLRDTQNHKREIEIGRTKLNKQSTHYNIMSLIAL